ncbi:6876_t:CDS:2, partial [Dentiscutata erythropus]
MKINPQSTSQNPIFTDIGVVYGVAGTINGGIISSRSVNQQKRKKNLSISKKNKEPVTVTLKKVKTDVKDDNPFINNNSSSSSTVQDSSISAFKSQNLDEIPLGPEESETELIAIDQDEEVKKLTQDESNIRNKLLTILFAQKEKDKKFGKNCMTSARHEPDPLPYRPGMDPARVYWAGP